MVNLVPDAPKGRVLEDVHVNINHTILRVRTAIELQALLPRLQQLSLQLEDTAIGSYGADVLTQAGMNIYLRAVRRVASARNESMRM